MHIVIQNHIYEGTIVPVVCRGSAGQYITFPSEELAFEYGHSMSLEFFVTKVETIEQIDEVLDRELFYG